MEKSDKERIEKEAAKHARFNYNNDVVEGAEYRGYIDGATAEHERAQQELQAYRDIIKELLPFAIKAQYSTSIHNEKGREDVRKILSTIELARKLIDTVTLT